MKTKKIYYYTLESMDGRVYFGTSTKRLAKKHFAEASNEGICYKRLVGDNSSLLHLPLSIVLLRH